MRLIGSNSGLGWKKSLTPAHGKMIGDTFHDPIAFNIYDAGTKRCHVPPYSIEWVRP